MLLAQVFLAVGFRLFRNPASRIWIFPQSCSSLVPNRGTAWIQSESISKPICFNLLQQLLAANTAPHYTRRPQSWARGAVFNGVCLSVYPHSETAAARVTKLDTEMFHNESWKPVYFWVKWSKVMVSRHKKQCQCGLLHSCECVLLLVYTQMITTLHKRFRSLSDLTQFAAIRCQTCAARKKVKKVNSV